jgi:site-specific recombinase XerD
VDEGLRARIEALPDYGERLFARSVTMPYKADTLRADLRRFAAASGVERKVTPHMLRHTAATLLLEDGVDLLFLQRLLGHQDISTTALYAHVADTSLRRALERAPVLQSLAS